MAINYNKQNKKMQQLEQKILILENNIKNAEYKMIVFLILNMKLLD